MNSRHNIMTLKTNENNVFLHFAETKQIPTLKKKT